MRYVVILSLFIMFPCLMFCSVQNAISFFEKQFEFKSSQSNSGDRLNDFEALVKESANKLKNMYPKLYQPDKPTIVHDFTSVNKYNLLTVGMILLGAYSIREECPYIFDFLEKNALCRKDCGDLEEVLMSRNAGARNTSYFIFDKSNKKFIPDVGKFVQLFLYGRLWGLTPFQDLLKNKDYNNKLFDIVAQYYVDEKDIKILRAKHEKMDQSDRERHSFELLINKYDAKKDVKDTGKKDNGIKEIDEQMEKVKNEIGQNLKKLEERGKKIEKLIEKADSLTNVIPDEGKNLSFSSYIPYFIGGGLILYFLYSFFKKQPSKN